MRKTKVGICFSKEFVGNKPFSHLGIKTSVYLKLLDMCLKENWDTFVLTRKTYWGEGVFKGVWKYNGKDFAKVGKSIKIDLVYDKTGGLVFPPEGDSSMVFVNNRAFKLLAWDKWSGYLAIKDFMPKTFWGGNISNITKLARKIGTKNIVVKPFNGLKGIGIYIGSKGGLKTFEFDEKKQYILQEFVDTSKGLKNITPGRHDLRVVIVNGKPVWCHVRVPLNESYLANAAQGGNLTEVDYQKVPQSIKTIVEKVSKDFMKKYDNPIYSLDFGMDKDGTPKIFEINDQIGFPREGMLKKDNFLTEMVYNFKSKL